MSDTVSSADLLPKWRSHKVVSAAPIQRVLGDDITLEGPYPTIKAPPGIFHRYAPAAGDYLVIYDDGYISVSPKAAFEAGYIRI